MKILLVDDHPLFRDGLKRIFTALPEVDEVLEAGDGVECLAMLEKHHIDAVMLDIRMPNMDGIECLRRIRMKWETLKVMVVTQFGEKRFIRSMIKSGANGYLLKTTSEENLVETFRQMMADNTKITEELLEETEPENPLGEREIEVLQLICEQYNSKEIAEKLHISKFTVDNHRANILEKTNSKNIAGLVRWAIIHNII